MPTRFNSKSQPKFGVVGINAKNDQGTPDLTIPPVGVEDVDVSLFNLFDKEIELQVGGNNSDFKKVPVIFATGEKWAILKKRKALRDRNNSLILPLLTIARTSVSQDFGDDITGRGINQQTGEIIIKRRLDKSDRGYQNLINRYLLKNQSNVATNPNLEHLPDQLLTDREVGADADKGLVRDGAWLADVKNNKLRSNIYETIVIPSPQFCSIDYEITVWTQYTQHMNQLLEQVISSFLPQGNAWQLNTPKGYWFIATVTNNSYDPENNFDELGQSERIIKYKFSVNVKAYIFASQQPGVGVPVKRYVSSPIISFETNVMGGVINNTTENVVTNPFLGSDDPTLPLSNDSTRKVGQRDNGGTRLYNPQDQKISSDPALASRTAKEYEPLYQKVTVQGPNGSTSEGYVRVYTVNQASGESVIKPATLAGSNPEAPDAQSLLGGLSYYNSKED